MNTDLKRYWVEVLCDDGDGYGAAIEGYSDNLEAVRKDAMQNAREWGLKPADVLTITDNDTDETVWRFGDE